MGMTYNNKNIVSAGENSPLKIAWELVTECQFSCSYCYFHPYESSIKYEEVMKLVMMKLKTTDQPIVITLIGGEPTLHPHFHSIVKELYAMDNVKRIEVITNFQAPVEFWEPLKPYAKKLELLLSYHVEYAQNVFFKKIEQLKDHFTNMTINFLVHNDEKYLPKMIEASDYYFSLNLDSVEITISKLVNHGNQVEYYPYTEKVLDFMKSLEKRVTKLKNQFAIKIGYEDGSSEEISQLLFLNHELNRYKGWKCQMNGFIIHSDGTVMNPCTHEKKHILVTELRGKKIICPLNYCGCDGYWEFEKEK